MDCIHIHIPNKIKNFYNPKEILSNSIPKADFLKFRVLSNQVPSTWRFVINTEVFPVAPSE